MQIAFITSIHPDFDARVWRYAVMMARRGHTVHLVCPWQVKEGDVRDGVTLHPFPRDRTRLSRPLSIPWHLATRLWPLLRVVDVVHFHDIDILPYMAVIALFKTVIYDVHENYPEEMLVREWIPGPLRRLLYHGVRWVQAGLSLLVRNVVFVVPEQQNDFPIRALHTAVIRNYASLDLLDRVSLDYRTRAATVVSIGTNYEANGTFLFLEIATGMLSRRPDIRFVITDRWADESTRQRALLLIQERQLKNVSFVPNVLPQDVIDHLNQATIGISSDLRVPQRIKALPTKLFEYLAAALPIVASDLPHATRLAEQTGAFVLCRPEEPQSFITAILHLVEDPEYANQLGHNGQHAFKEYFSWESQAGTLEQFYRESLAHDPSHSNDLSGIAIN